MIDVPGQLYFDFYKTTDVPGQLYFDFFKKGFVYEDQERKKEIKKTGIEKAKERD